ncbi:MAG TPA: glycosyltransferase 87 family protein [Micromonosporaceae bacterium]|nr:glycosyltransferase 87 family protein [Micromonosporaceae bacterium]
MSQRTRREVLAVAALAVAVAVFLWLVAVRHGFFDLNVYFGALNHWADGGQLYDYLRPRTEYGFTYPPFAALAMLPMAFVPWHVTIVVSVLLNLGTTAAVLYWLVDPVARREGWTRWFAFAVAACLAAAYEPMRETFTFGQVNMLLVFLVFADVVLLLGRGSRWAGVGIGLATAVKLTPGIFILYLLVTRRYRAAVVASATAAGATLLAAAAAPDASRIFWTEALWNTERIGALSFVSNQSLQGVLARLDPGDPSRALWLAVVLTVLAVWAWRVRRAVAAGDELTGAALTGVVGCLVSPVTWVHHLVWLVPALALLVDNGMRAAPRSHRRVALLVWAAATYVLLCSALVWAWWWDTSGVDAFLGSNAYVWASLALLLGLPIRSQAAPECPGGHSRVAALREAGRGTLAADPEGPAASPESGVPWSPAAQKMYVRR